MVRLLVCGGRDFADRELVFRVLDKFHQQTPVGVLINGSSETPERVVRRICGADELAFTWAIERGVDWTQFPADWRGEGKAAGPRRNTRMLFTGRPDVVLAFEGGDGTNNMVFQAITANVKTGRVFTNGHIAYTPRKLGMKV